MIRCPLDFHDRFVAELDRGRSPRRITLPHCLHNAVPKIQPVQHENFRKWQPVDLPLLCLKDEVFDVIVMVTYPEISSTSGDSWNRTGTHRRANQTAQSDLDSGRHRPLPSFRSYHRRSYRCASILDLSPFNGHLFPVSIKGWNTSFDWPRGYKPLGRSAGH